MLLQYNNKFYLSGKKIGIYKSFYIIEDLFGQLIEKNLSLCLMFSSLLDL